MRNGSVIGTIVLAASLAALTADAQAFDDAKYPAFAGQWLRNAGAQWDPSMPRGKRAAGAADRGISGHPGSQSGGAASGGDTYNPQAHCLPGGMPRMMIAYDPIELIITPEVTYV